MDEIEIFLTNNAIDSTQLIKRILCKKKGIVSSEIHIIKNENGKPYLVDQELFFNMSHCRDMLICAIFSSDIGIDLEELTTANFKIMNRFFTEKEKKYITEEQQKINYRFFEIWTKKEAYIKYLGTRVKNPLNTIDMIGDPRLKTILIDNYILSICIGNNIEDYKLKIHKDLRSNL